MIAKVISGLGAAALLAGVTIAAQPANRPATSKNASERQICRTFYEQGTRLGAYRVCKTAAEWDEQRRQTRQNIDHIQNARPS